jgi:hypothetical protein
VRALAALSALACATACASEGTRILAVADTDLAIPTEVDSIRIEVDAVGIGAGEHAREVTLGAVPVVVPILHREGPFGPLDVSAIALRGGEPVASDSARVSFEDGRTTIVRLHLSTRHAPEDGDAGRELDAGCIVERACSGAACACPAGCRCGFECTEGDACGVECAGSGTECAIAAGASSSLELRCEERASCSVDARGARDARGIECRDGASCDVDCRGADECRVRCGAGARCLVACEGAGSCTLDCDVFRGDCGDRVYACGRACP